MHIRDIEFSRITVKPDACAGDVILLTDSGATQCVCNVPMHGQTDIVSVQQALLSEALRQIGRMPEYRRGQRSISMAPHLLDQNPAMPAAA